MTQNTLRDQPVHPGIGLMQPEPANLIASNAEASPVLDDHLSHHRHHFLEYLAALLDKQLVAFRVFLIDRFAVRAVQKSEVIADIVRTGSDTSRISSTSWRTMGAVICPGALTAMPSARVSPRMGSCVPLMALYIEG